MHLEAESLKFPATKDATIAWVQEKLNKPPFPISPHQSLLHNKQEKQPAYYDGKYYKSLEWKPYQNWHQLEPRLRVKLIEIWHKNSQIDGISTLGGFNGKHWLGWIDFDIDNFQDSAAMEYAIANWMNCYPILERAPHFKTPSGGHRFLVAWQTEPKEFGANNGFTFERGSGQKLGELLTKNGGHTLLPPTLGANGKRYEWIYFAEYPPLADAPESIGIYKVEDRFFTKNSPVITKEKARNGSTDSDYARSYLQALASWRADRYDTWLKVGMALHSVGDESLLDEWDFWSSQSQKYVPGECSQKWHSFKGSGITLGTLAQMAIEDGWQSPFTKNKNKIQEWNPPSDCTAKARENWIQKAYDAIFASERWICVLGTMYRYTGTRYQAVDDAILQKDIARWCDTHAVPKRTRDGIIWVYDYAKPACVQTVLKWAKQKNGVTIDRLNPPGINLKNGILQIVWHDNKPSHQLVPHSPNYYYTYCSEAIYNPDADTRECDRLLAALDRPQLDIFLKIIAASLDLKTVRRSLGRSIRALLLQGVGSNGKDSLREVVKQLYGGTGMSSCSITDFKQYDRGRKFPLYPLGNNPRINWSSENTSFACLDGIQCLKQAITGDTISIEKKGKDEIEIEPDTVFIFNINEAPSINGSLEAIKSRYAAITFNKVFKTNPDSKQGELQADPRFKYDPSFIRDRILPAFLNKLLSALSQLIAEGIDYTPVEGAFDKIQQESNHLIAFCHDVGLRESRDAITPVREIWERLKIWYLEQGTLEIEESDNETQRLIWHEQIRKEDKTVKALNQVAARFLQLFPKAKTQKNKDGFYLVGIEFTGTK